MPTLNWIGRKAVENHHRQVPFHLLKDVPELSGGDPGAGNLLVEGDNLLALKALLPYYGGQVKCIYIDPPYNTGEESWVYNDNVNSPEIRSWLGKTVGKETDDLTRHDKWLCMMYPRLCLLREMLRWDGAIFVSIDDNEVAHLRLLMDEIFGATNFIAHFIWEKRKNRENRKRVSVRHDHIIAYARQASLTLSRFHLLPMDANALDRYKNPDNDKRGPWKSDPATAQAGHGTKSQFYALIAPNGKSHSLPSGRCWVYTQDAMSRAIADGRIWFGVHGNNVPRIKTFLNEKERGLTPETLLFAADVSTNEEAKNSLKNLFDGNAAFETPKPVALLLRLLQMCTRAGDLILDSFAGSGTTGHAVMQLNKEDGGNRRFILVEMDPNICRNVTAERLRRVSEGYSVDATASSRSDGESGEGAASTKAKSVQGLGGGFRFATLGDALFDERGSIRSTVRFGDLARHVYFVETGEPLPVFAKATPGKPERGTGVPPVKKHGQDGRATLNSPLLGVHNGTGIYLLYNGILKDKSPDGGNVLTTPVLSVLPKHDGPKVIYGTACRLGAARLRHEGIVFKQLPYKLKVDAR